jgi:MoxR-like ATPase
MLKVIVTYPSVTEERAVLDAMAISKPRLTVTPVVPLDVIAKAREVVDEVYLDDAIRDYIVRVVAATRNPARYGVELGGLVRAGASPRATIALALAARGWAFLQGRGYVVPEDVKALAPDVMRHRITTTFEAEADGIDGDEIVRRVLNKVVSP